MNISVHEKKRKSGTNKPASKSKKLQRAAAYHSSSSEDDVVTPGKSNVPKEPEYSYDQHSNSEAEDVNDVELPNTLTESQTVIDFAREDGHDGRLSDDAEDASLDSDIGDYEDDDEDDDLEDGSITISSGLRRNSKRHDPSAFANSMQRILSSKLTSAKRSDPVLSRSATAHAASKSLSEQKLDTAARRKLRAEKKAATEKGRIKDVLGLSREDLNAGEVVEMEKQLRRTAQKGVVKLFNAVRAAQMSGLQAEKEAQGEESKVVGIDSRKRKVDEMSKQGFLDLLAGGKAAAT